MVQMIEKKFQTCEGSGCPHTTTAKFVIQVLNNKSLNNPKSFELEHVSACQRYNVRNQQIILKNVDYIINI